MVIKNRLSDSPSLCVCACLYACMPACVCMRVFNNIFVSQALFNIHGFGIELISSVAQSRNMVNVHIVYIIQTAV